MKLPSVFRRLLRLPEPDYYECRHCGYRMPKEEANISGWEESASCPPHVHCPRCGRKIAVL